MRFLGDNSAVVKSFEEMSGRKPSKHKRVDRKDQLDNAAEKVEVEQDCLPAFCPKTSAVHRILRPQGQRSVHRSERGVGSGGWRMPVNLLQFFNEEERRGLTFAAAP